MFVLRLGLVAALAAAVAGCSQSRPSATVKGTFRYKGQPIPAGEVYFVFADGGQYNANLKSDGSYTFGDIPTGTVKVFLDTEGFNPEQKPVSYQAAKGGYATKMGKNYREYDAVVGKGDHPGGKAGGGKAEGPGLTKEQKEDLAKKYVKIPKQYTSEKTTPLTFTVERGSQTKDFDLTD
jgi:hypothetical protein